MLNVLMVILHQVSKAKNFVIESFPLKSQNVFFVILINPQIIYFCVKLHLNKVNFAHSLLHRITVDQLKFTRNLFLQCL